MRIIAGAKRGMKLLPPKGMETRPITDRVKESLFSVLYKYDVIEDGIVADLFCGTGSMGLECLSRGARGVTFVDQSTNVLEILNKNIARADFVDRSKVIRGNAFEIGAPVAVGTQDTYGLVFVDPPYAMAKDTATNSRLGMVLDLLCGQVDEGAIVVVRTDEYTQLLDEYGRLRIMDSRKWGTMAITLLVNGERKV